MDATTGQGTPGKRELRTLLTGLAMGENPRWHEGRLWLTDMAAGEVLALDERGNRETVAGIRTLGFGWLPDGRLLVVSMGDGRLLRREPDGSFVLHADLAALDAHPWNEIAVTRSGAVYADTVGFDFPGGEFAPGGIALVRPDGSVRRVADGLAFPNGLALTPEGRTLIVAESYAERLTAFDVEADGSLSSRRAWAELPGAHPDGICLDADGAAWYADVPAKRCVRVAEGGRMLDVVDLDRGAFACTLGGPDGRTLFIVAAEFPIGRERTGVVLATRAPAPAAGWI